MRKMWRFVVNVGSLRSEPRKVGLRRVRGFEAFVT